MTQHTYPHTDLASPRPRPARVVPREPLGQVAALTMLGLILGLVVCAACLSGCGITEAQRRLVAENAAAGQADLREWDSLTSEQRRAAHRASVAGWVALDYAFNEREPGPEWRATTGAVTSRTGQ